MVSRTYVTLPTLPAAVRNWRKRTNMTVREFGDFVGISRTSVSRIEGGHIPDLRTLQGIADATGLKFSIVGREGGRVGGAKRP